MKTRALALGLGAAALLSLGACNNNANNSDGSKEAPKAQTKEAEKAAGNKTIAAGLAANSKFMTSAKAAGLDQTLAGAGPYTVFVPDDAAFGNDKALAATPENRPQLTGVITNLILQGTVMAEDIDKLIDRNKGKALLATTAGGTLTATKEDGKIVLTDAAGHKASVTKADEIYSNGVVHHISAVLMPAKGTSAPLAVGEKAGK
jgi:uncharacterized surface protein with fasciclin (FAS1) repeats